MTFGRNQRQTLETDLQIVWQMAVQECGHDVAMCTKCGAEFDKPKARIRTSICLPCRITKTLIVRRASAIVARAIRHGQLPRPTSLQCFVCGRKASIYEHRDYTQPLDVKPACRSCNGRLGAAARWPKTEKEMPQ